MKLLNIKKERVDLFLENHLRHLSGELKLTVAHQKNKIKVLSIHVTKEVGPLMMLRPSLKRNSCYIPIIMLCLSCDKYENLLSLYSPEVINNSVDTNQLIDPDEKTNITDPIENC